MNKTDWNDIHVGDIILSPPDDRMYVSTVELINHEKRPREVGDVWGTDSREDVVVHLTRERGIVPKLRVIKCPPALPVIGDRVIYPGSRDWPNVVWPYHPDASRRD